ncbi:MAG TPA: hypothetical protein VMC03_03560 [Streptosporangiaceae bacterium]|nr:hypothetical protein [Streptosporangiaceae bacterium]
MGPVGVGTATSASTSGGTSGGTGTGTDHASLAVARAARGRLVLPRPEGLERRGQAGRGASGFRA